MLFHPTPGGFSAGIVALESESYPILLFRFKVFRKHLVGRLFYLNFLSRLVATPSICSNNSFPAFPSIIQKFLTMLFPPSPHSNYVIQTIIVTISMFRTLCATTYSPTMRSHHIRIFAAPGQARRPTRVPARVRKGLRV